MDNIKNLAMAGELVAIKPIEADLVITLRGNPTQMAIRFNSMRLATKEFDKLHEMLTKAHKGPRAIHIIKSELMTGVFVCSEVISWVLVDRQALDASFRAMGPQP